VTVSLGNPSLGAGLGTTAIATLRNMAGDVVTGRTVTWSSSAPAVATVSGAGAVTALLPGTATITGRSEGQTGGATLTVTANPVATVTVALANPNLTQGASTQAVATIRDGAGNTLTGRTVTWSSAAAGVATVTAGGAVTAVGPGAVLITAKSEGQSGSAALTVTAVSVASVTVRLATPRVGVGGLSQAAAVLVDAGGNALSGRVVTWSSSNTAVATVLATGGRITAVGLGTSTITATSEGLSGSATITVTAMYPVTAIDQTAAPSMSVVQPPAVKVTDGTGAALSGMPVVFTVTAGGGTISGGPWVTDATGSARLSSWTFGPAGAQAVTATAASVPGVTVEFAGLARAPTAGYDITLRPTTSMTDSQLKAFVDAKERIQQLITRDESDNPVNLSAVELARCGGRAVMETVDDVIIFAEISYIDGKGDANGNILGQAGPCVFRGDATGLPLVGHMQFDSYDVPTMEAQGILEIVILHEMMHVLGFGILWVQDSYLAGSGTLTPYFTGPGARSAFNTYNGGTTYPGSPVPVEGTGGTGTVDSHRREADFDAELMTGWIGDKTVPHPLSATTVASMADLGYGVADLTRADPYRWGARTMALRQAALQSAEPPIHLGDDILRIPPIVVGPDGKPIFP
jgi:uncharacterized protein YjdB